MVADVKLFDEMVIPATFKEFANNKSAKKVSVKVLVLDLKIIYQYSNVKHQMNQ
jgi:hypothetical protein